MCGICGFVGLQDDMLLSQMMEQLRHRGPDSEGCYISPEVSLGHRRLSIIDLLMGDQPIYNEDKTLCIIFNGEIYNFRSLRTRLESRGHVFYTNTDTEVVLHAYEDMGENCVDLLNGEFAFSLWDSKAQTLFLARDRLGIRPLYYCQSGDELVFSSEIKPLLLWKKTSRRINPLAVDCYLSLRYVPANMVLIEGINKLPPASTMIFHNGHMRIRQYWSADWKQAVINQHRLIEEDFFGLLEESVRLRLMSEVPLGAYLSGGLDSSLIVAMMSQFSSAPVKTYTIGGFGADVDETRKAQLIASRFNTEHHEIIIEKQDYELLPLIASHMDSPTGDSIVIPTFLLAKETAKQVKVVLTGEGADEILGGYIHHLVMNYSDIFKRYTPLLFQRILMFVIDAMPVKALNHLFPYPAKLGEEGKEKLLKFIKITVNESSVGNEFLALAGLFHDRKSLYTNSFFHELRDKDFLVNRMDAAISHAPNFLNKLILYDLENWLPNNTLSKQDSLGMANSLEARVPYLDHRIVEFTCALPANYKIRGLLNKYLLRKVGRRLLPKYVSGEPKQAFYFPVERVFGKSFDNFVKDILISDRFHSRNIFNSQYIEKSLQQVRSSELVNNKQVMTLLFLELWFRSFIDQDA